MHRPTFLLAMITLLFSGAGCGEDPGSSAASITISSSGMYDGEMLLLKDEGELVTVIAKDAAGKTLTLNGGVSWTSSAPDIVTLNDMGNTGLAEGIADWFDVTGIAADEDPKATLTATYQGLTASIDASVILDAEGVWSVTVGSDAPLDVPFLQTGRTLAQPLAGMEGEIHGTGVDTDGNVESWSATR